ncbi:glycosyltransferase family protein [Azospirillum agricola]|uniref:glycosyltransferase family protein n=1 Tax=Azospirillum agricola TaxID=1720247 RepID=UPI000A0F19CF|nr:glycosyltransferase [Azospirillum agricola]SMH44109.1 Predicted glycosyl transferase [Azospirillum lipoferum]
MSLPQAAPRSDHGDRTAPRILLYSHDTFGLGHLRRSRTIAQALVSAFPDASALILTGSPVAGRFDFPERVDHVRLPGVVKLQDGSYTAQNLGLPIEEMTAMRAEIIRAAAQSFRPTLAVVDKEPTGLHGEFVPALEMMRTSGRTRVVLGLRDVLDSPDALQPEWERKEALTAIRRYYDEVWIYGLREVYQPLAGLDLPADVEARLRYTGYLRRGTPPEAPADASPFVLVTPGGGGDGGALIDWTLSAYEHDPSLAPRALIVYGPFLDGAMRKGFAKRIRRLKGRVEAMDFHSRMEDLYAGAIGVVAMGGYNTFCEILSFDKPSVIAPRTRPRMEQHIRAAAAEALGLTRMLDCERDGTGPQVMADAIRALASQPPPSANPLPSLLSGLESVVALARDAMADLMEPAPLWAARSA